MLYERKLGSFSALLDELTTMDADAGLRVDGRYEGHSCYVFVTRFGATYTAMVYERLFGEGRALGKRLAVEELSGIDELQALLSKLVHGRVVAFAY